jgi:hypothetical protein
VDAPLCAGIHTCMLAAATLTDGATSCVLRDLSQNRLNGTLPASFATMSSVVDLCAGSLAAALFGLDCGLRSLVVG